MLLIIIRELCLSFLFSLPILTTVYPTQFKLGECVAGDLTKYDAKSDIIWMNISHILAKSTLLPLFPLCGCRLLHSLCVEAYTYTQGHI